MTILQILEQDKQDLETLLDWVRFSWTSMNQRDLYYGHGTDNAYDESVQLVLGVLRLPWNTPEALWATRLTRSEKEAICEALEARTNKRLPLPYILGRAYFGGHEFVVNQDVLIPRSPFAELIQQGFQPWIGSNQAKRMLDLCSGSGCIGILEAIEDPDVQVDLVDISEEANAVAHENIRAHGLGDQVRVIQSDLFSNLKPEVDQYDIILANPPYAANNEIEDIPQEYLHEPRLALYSGDDGLDLVRQILASASQFLTAKGLLFCEVGYTWDALEAAFPSYGFTWVGFEEGGEGVFVMTRDELLEFNLEFAR